MATLIEIDDDVARETQAVADRDGLPVARYIEAALARANADRRAADHEVRPPLIPVSLLGGGLVDGMTVKEALVQLDYEYDLKKLGRSGADADAPL